MLVRERKKSLDRIRVFNGGKKPRRLRAIAVLLLGVFFGMLLLMTSARTARRVLSRIHGGLDISSNEPELLNARVLGLNNFPTADSGKKWERPQLLPENMERLLTYRMRPTRMANQSISRLIDQVIPGKSRILGTEEELDAAKKIAKGLKIWVSPIDRYALNCLTVGVECDKNLGCWDKRLSLFLREVFSDVHPMEADFIFIPYFQYCYFYSSGCYATIGQRGTNTMEVLSIVFNETMNILDRHAPGRNWTGRFVVPFSHDFGGCVHFAMEEKLKEELIVGQPPVLQQSVVLSAFGDWDDSNCFDLKKDIVMPAYIDYESLDKVNEIPKSSRRRYMIYFAGTLDFDLRKRGIRKTLTDKKNYKHPEKHVLDRLETRAEYNYVLHNTIFCVGPPGVVGWTGRVWEALYSGCIPVFLSEKTKHPWEEYVDYRKFSIMLDYSFADKLEGFLDAMDMKEIERLQEEGQKYKEMFIYRPPFNQEDGPFSFMFKSLRERKEALEGHLNEGDLPRSVRRDQAWREEEQVAHEPDRRKEEAEDSNPARKTTRTKRLRQGRERGRTRN